MKTKWKVSFDCPYIKIIPSLREKHSTVWNKHCGVCWRLWFLIQYSLSHSTAACPMRQRAAGSIMGAVPRTPTPQQSTPSVCCYHADPRPSRGCNLGFAEQGAVWHHGVIGPSSFISTVPLTGPIRVEQVPLIASTINARSHTALQGPCCPYLLWMMLEERRW